MTDEVRVVDEGGIRTITIDRPGSRNGLTPEVNQAIMDALASATADPAMRVIALTGAGGAFCSGADLKARSTITFQPGQAEERMRRYFHGLIRAVVACPLPVVALVDGAAVGFGCDLALACDLRLCSARARFGEIFVKRGLMPDGGGTFTLPRLVGVGRALELMLLGDMVTAEDALRIGLANRVFPVEGFVAAAGEILGRIAAGPPLVHRAVKRAVWGGLHGNLDLALDVEAEGQLKLLASRDFAEGLAAFLQKRPPVFKGD